MGKKDQLGDDLLKEARKQHEVASHNLQSGGKVLPSLIDLYNEEEIEGLDKYQDLNILLNQKPKPEWIKTHPFVKSLKYIPIGRLEYLMTRIFIKWWVEIKTQQLIANSVVLTVRVHYQCPITGEWNCQDGIGAVPLQTDEGAGAIDFNKMKSAAVMIAAPAAKTFAIKDAIEQIGKIFGRDLNRKDEISYDMLIDQFKGKININTLRKELELKLSQCQDIELREFIINEIAEAKKSKADTEDFYIRILTTYFKSESNDNK
jgi:hypothetical protein